MERARGIELHKPPVAEPEFIVRGTCADAAEMRSDSTLSQCSSPCPPVDRGGDDDGLIDVDVESWDCFPCQSDFSRERTRRLARRSPPDPVEVTERAEVTVEDTVEQRQESVALFETVLAQRFRVAMRACSDGGEALIDHNEVRTIEIEVSKGSKKQQKQRPNVQRQAAQWAIQMNAADKRRDAQYKIQVHAYISVLSLVQLRKYLRELGVDSEDMDRIADKEILRSRLDIQWDTVRDRAIKTMRLADHDTLGVEEEDAANGNLIHSPHINHYLYGHPARFKQGQRLVRVDKVWLRDINDLRVLTEDSSISDHQLCECTFTVSNVHSR